MKIAIDISPITRIEKLSHRVRGTGFYIENLKNSLLRFYPKNEYIFFTTSKELTPDVNIVHYPYFEPFFLSLPWRNQYRTVITVHDLIPLVFAKEFPVGIKGKIKWAIQKKLLQKATAIITDSNASKIDIMKYVSIPAEKISVIYLAASEEYSVKKYKKEEIAHLRKKYQLPKKFALYVGDATWNKNLVRLIKAVNLSKIPLVMVGSALVGENIDKKNPWNKELVEVQSLAQQSKNIQRLGFVSNEDLVALYNLATVFVMPSLYEGFGLPLIEAMQCGCPVVTSPEGSIQEITEDAAVFVDPVNIEDIAKNLLTVFQDPKLCQDLSRRGLIQARKFSWEKTAYNTVNVYKAVASHRYV